MATQVRHTICSVVSRGEAQSLMLALLRELPAGPSGTLRHEVQRELEAFGDRAVLLALARLLAGELGGGAR